LLLYAHLFLLLGKRAEFHLEGHRV
jgi:hypothetical protein